MRLLHVKFFRLFSLEFPGNFAMEKAPKIGNLKAQKLREKVPGVSISIKAESNINKVTTRKLPLSQ
jgi:divalent metal cation (Fe/Co/Zn/Cd) transporter